MATFIRDKSKRQIFRNKYKRNSKFRKLREDNRRILNDVGRILKDLNSIKLDLNRLRIDYYAHLYEWECSKYISFDVGPIDDSKPKGPDSNVFLAIACIAKNEGPYLKEWIEYHKLVGVERFYFYDNESDDNTKDILESYIKDGIVVYHFLPNHPITKQVPHIEAFNDAIFKYRDKTRWLALIDVDEFIVPVEKDTIPAFLADFDKCPGVVVNWVCFDSNGHDKKPLTHGGLITANYTRVRKDHNVYFDRLVKSIVNPKQVVKYISAHDGIYYLNNPARTENFQANRGQTTKLHSTNKIRINHYKTKSREEYYQKTMRNLKGFHAAGKFDESLLNFQEETAEDLVIQKYVPQLKNVLGIED